MMDAVAIVAMCAITIFLGISTYLLHTIRRHHVAVIAHLKGMSAQYMAGFDIVNAELERLAARVKTLEGSNG